MSPDLIPKVGLQMHEFPPILDNIFIYNYVFNLKVYIPQLGKAPLLIN